MSPHPDDSDSPVTHSRRIRFSPATYDGSSNHDVDGPHQAQADNRQLHDGDGFHDDDVDEDDGDNDKSNYDTGGRGESVLVADFDAAFEAHRASYDGGSPTAAGPSGLSPDSSSSGTPPISDDDDDQAGQADAKPYDEQLTTPEGTVCVL